MLKLHFYTQCNISAFVGFVVWILGYILSVTDAVATASLHNVMINTPSLIVPVFSSWLDSPSGLRPSLGCSSITLRHTTLDRTPLDEWSAPLRGLYLTTHTTLTTDGTSMPPAGFKPAITASERPQTHALNHAVIGNGNCTCTYHTGTWMSGGVAPRILNFGTRWSWVVSFTFRPLYPVRKNTSTNWKILQFNIKTMIISRISIIVTDY